MPTDIWGLLVQGIGQTLYMVLVSTLCAYVLGIPIGVVLYITDKTGICPNRWVNTILGIIVNLLRSIPFIILLIAIGYPHYTFTGFTCQFRASKTFSKKF